MSWRGRTLFWERSPLRVRHVVLRDALTMKTLHSHASLKLAERYCRVNGYSLMPTPEIDEEVLHQKV